MDGSEALGKPPTTPAARPSQGSLVSSQKSRQPTPQATSPVVELRDFMVPFQDIPIQIYAKPQPADVQPPEPFDFSDHTSELQLTRKEQKALLDSATAASSSGPPPAPPPSQPSASQAKARPATRLRSKTAQPIVIEDSPPMSASHIQEANEKAWNEKWAKLQAWHDKLELLFPNKTSLRGYNSRERAVIAADKADILNKMQRHMNQKPGVFKQRRVPSTPDYNVPKYAGKRLAGADSNERGAYRMQGVNSASTIARGFKKAYADSSGIWYDPTENIMYVSGMRDNPADILAGFESAFLPEGLDESERLHTFDFDYKKYRPFMVRGHSMGGAVIDRYFRNVAPGDRPVMQTFNSPFSPFNRPQVVTERYRHPADFISAGDVGATVIPDLGWWQHGYDEFNLFRASTPLDQAKSAQASDALRGKRRR